MQHTSASKDFQASFAEWKTERLHSWKEIASYFGREVRTVQLWEKNEGLPIRRQHHQKLGSVYAYRQELESWWLGRSRQSLQAAPSQAQSETPVRCDRSEAQAAEIGRMLIFPSEAVHSVKDGAAYHASMTGLHFWKQGTRIDLLKALSYFKDAILIDPAYADAYAGLTDTYVSLSYNHLMPARHAIEAAQRAIHMALMLDAQSIHVRNAEINFHKNCSWDWHAAERGCLRILDSGDVNLRTLELYASLMINHGRHEDAISLALHAHRLNPLSESVNSQVSFAYFYAGDYDNAISFVRRTIALKPQFSVGHALLGRAEAQKGNWNEAIHAFSRGLALADDPSFLKALLAYAYAGRGEASAADQLLREIATQDGDACFPAVDVSAVYAMLKRPDKALQNISIAYQLRDIKVTYIQHDPRFSGLRALPQFQQIASSVSSCAS